MLANGQAADISTPWHPCTQPAARNTLRAAHVALCMLVNSPNCGSDPQFMQCTGRKPLSDAERFDGLCDGLSRAGLTSVARAVREERAGLTIPSHGIYAQRILAGRKDAYAPIYPTPPGIHGARRCISGKLEARPNSAGADRRPPSANATYTSPHLLRHFADPGPEAPRRPATATAHAAASAWRSPLDAHVNAQAYAWHRATGLGLPPPPCSAPEILDVAAEQAAGATADDEPGHNSDDALLPASPLMPGMRACAAEAEETTPPPAMPSMAPKPSLSASARSTRRALEMSAQFYSSLRPPAAARFQVPPPPAVVQGSIARTRALEASRSDIFGHGIDGRGHWDVGPSVPPRAQPGVLADK